MPYKPPLPDGRGSVERRRWRYLATLLVILALAYYVVRKARSSPEWQHFDVHKLLVSLGQIRVPELLGAILLIYLTYLLRSLRWREFTRPVKRASLRQLMIATVVGFGAVAVFGRPGELVRPYMISRQEDIPLSGQLAVWILERFYDGVSLVLLVGLSIFLSGMTDDPTGQMAPVLRSLRSAGTVLMAVTLAGLTLLILYEGHLKTWEPWLLAKLAFLPRPTAEPIRRHFVSFAHGLASVHSARALLLGAAYSAAVWMTVSSAFWLTLQAFGPPIDDLNFPAAMLVMGFAIAGSIIQLPGVGGGSQIFAILALTELYGVGPETATSAGVVLWAMTFLAVLPLAVVLSIKEGLTWGKLRSMTRAERSL